MLILRLRTTGGHCRLSVDDAITFGDLKKKISEQITIPFGEFLLFRDVNYLQPLFGEDNLPLRSLGLDNGSLIFIKSSIIPKISSEVLGRINSEKSTSIKKEDSNSVATSDASKEQKEFIDIVSENDEPISTYPPFQKSSFSFTNSSSNIDTASSANADENSSGFHKRDAKEPTFKSFDQFLKDRDYILSDLPYLISYCPVELVPGKMTKVPPSVTLKHQPYRHVDHIEIMNVQEIKSFVNYWHYDLDMTVQRCGWMYGYYVEDKHYAQGIRAVCEAIYQPPQEYHDNYIELLPDNLIDDVDKIAECLELERIGWIFTHLPRNELLTSHELVQILKLQLNSLKHCHYSGYEVSKFITCTVSPDMNSGGEPVLNAFMVSDMGMALVRDGLIADNQLDTSHIQLKKPRPGELIPQILESGKETLRFDVDWLIVRIIESAPKKIRSIFKFNHFPKENTMTPPTSKDIQKYLNNPLLNSFPKANAQRFADFHLLIYISSLFDVHMALSICEAIRDKMPCDSELEDILTTL